MTTLNLSQSSLGLTGLSLADISTSSDTMEEKGQSSIRMDEDDDVLDNDNSKKNKGEENDTSSSEEEEDNVNNERDDDGNNIEKQNVNNKTEENSNATGPVLTEDIVDDASRMEIDPLVIQKLVSDLNDIPSVQADLVDIKPVISDLVYPKKVDVPDTTQMETDSSNSESSSSGDESDGTSSSSSEDDDDDQQIPEKNEPTPKKDEDEQMPEADSGFSLREDLNMSDNSCESSSLKVLFTTRMDEVMKNSLDLKEKMTKLSKMIRTDKNIGKNHPLHDKLSSFSRLAHCLVCVDKDEVEQIRRGMKVCGNYYNETDPYRFDKRVGLSIDKLNGGIDHLYAEYADFLQKQMEKVAKGQRSKKQQEKE